MRWLMIHPIFNTQFNARIRFAPDPRGLGFAQRQTHSMGYTVLADDPAKHPSPAAADIQNALTARSSCLGDVVVHFANLGLVDLFLLLAVGEEGAGVSHGGIKPQPVKLVACVIVKTDGFD